jgi:uncharacterized membrane protein YeaQ/YmgE (transglycosylase-associated protein family)
MILGVIGGVVGSAIFQALGREGMTGINLPSIMIAVLELFSS